jgi:putative membrane protein
LPTAPTAAAQRELAAARAKAGSSAYDTAWLNAQDKAHQQTLALIDKELRSGTDSRVKAAAKAARPVVAMHAEMVSGGTCRDTMPPGDINAGDSGQVAAAEAGHEEAGLATVIVGLLLAGSGGAVWAVRRRRNSADAEARH